MDYDDKYDTWILLVLGVIYYYNTLFKNIFLDKKNKYTLSQ